MNERFRRMEEIFQAAADLSEADRGPFLDRECGADTDTRRRVEALLRQMEAGESLGPPTVAAELLGGELTEGPGSVIGRYKLLQRIGEGGFGVVYMAEQQQPVVRKVALKIIKLGMDTAQVVARFEAERQALAMMEHPNIARVLDGGATETGRPYFVMELIRGIPITAYCDQNHLGTRERLDLFAQVCRAVQHAHQKGIIHRDLKPNNVMVTLHDGTPVPKVIDFGIAKATNQRLTERTLFTEYEQLIGTPTYMSPEQAEMSGLDVDTRTDIYSLGVLLYELLTGTTPFEAKTLHRAGYAEMQRIIREIDPPRPSTRLSTLGDALATIARNRRLDGVSLGRLVRGDLDWIVMKALEKDRSRRYETASALAADVGRYLGDQPVEAIPPRALYQLRKMLRRHRTAVLTGGLLAATLIAGLVGTTWGMLASRRAEREALRQRNAARTSQLRAEDEATRAQAVTEFMVGLLASTDRRVALTPDMSVRSVLDNAADRALELAEQPAVEAAVRTTIGLAYESLGELDLAEVHLRRAVELQDSLPDVSHLEAHRTLWALTHVLFDLERGDSFAIATRARFVGNAALAEMSPELAAKVDRFLDAIEEGDMESANALLDEANRLAEARLPAGHPLWILYADACMYAGYSLWYTPIEPASERFYAEALKIQRRELAPAHPQIGSTLSLIVGVLNRTGEFQRAETYVREALEIARSSLPEEHIQLAFSESLLGEALAGQGRFEAAEPLLVNAYEVVAASAGAEKFASLDSLSRLVDLYDAWGRPEAVAPYRRELAEIMATTRYPQPWSITRRAFGPEHEALVRAMDPVPMPSGAHAGPDPDRIRTTGELSAALERVVTLRRSLLDEDDARAALIARMLVGGAMDWDVEPSAAARKLVFADATAVLRHRRDALPAVYALALAERSDVTRETGDRDDAERLLRAATTEMERAPKPISWRVALIQTHVGEIAARHERFQEAERLLEEALPALNRHFGPVHPWTEQCRSAVVEMYLAWERPVAAQPHVDEGLAVARRRAEHPDASDVDRATWAKWRDVQRRVIEASTRKEAAG